MAVVHTLVGLAIGFFLGFLAATLLAASGDRHDDK